MIPLHFFYSMLLITYIYIYIYIYETLKYTNQEIEQINVIILFKQNFLIIRSDLKLASTVAHLFFLFELAIFRLLPGN